MIRPDNISNKAGVPEVVVRLPGWVYKAPANMTRRAATEWAYQHIPWYHRRTFLETYAYGGDERDSEE